MNVAMYVYGIKSEKEGGRSASLCPGVYGCAQMIVFVCGLQVRLLIKLCGFGMIYWMAQSFKV